VLVFRVAVRERLLSYPRRCSWLSFRCCRSLSSRCATYTFCICCSYSTFIYVSSYIIIVSSPCTVIISHCTILVSSSFVCCFNSCPKHHLPSSPHDVSTSRSRSLNVTRIHHPNIYGCRRSRHIRSLAPGSGIGAVPVNLLHVAFLATAKPRERVSGRVLHAAYNVEAGLL
jgi:hypothetical protein